MAKISLSALLSGIRGKVGGVVFTEGRSGNVARIRVIPANPATSGQINARTHLQAAAQAFKALSSANLSAWETYVSGITRNQSVSGQSYHPSAISAYVEQYAKLLQYNPAAAAPTTPPATQYAGDTITVTCAGGNDKVTFTPSAANTAGSVTELLLQPLVSANRTPNGNGYRNKAFTAFPGGAAVDVTSLGAGWYSPAYRFVNTTTGEATGLTILPKVEVT